MALHNLAARPACDGGYYYAPQPLPDPLGMNFSYTACGNTMLKYYTCPAGFFCRLSNFCA